MCEAFEGETDIEDVEPKLDEDYILEPFPNDQFIPDAWQDILATMDVCVNEVTSTIFCDEEGFGIIPIHMVRVLHEETKQEDDEQETTTVNLTYGGSRPDVCKVWVGYPKCNNVGYSGTIDVSKLDKNCKHLLEIIATDGDNNTRTIARRLLTVK